ncbi:MAG: S8 family serine peptidase, partial [Pseudomonadota bacterium]
MIRRTTVLITGLLLILGACASAPAPVADAPPWRLVAADRIADARHLVLTVDLAEPARLAALSEALEAAYPIELVAEWPLRSIEVHCLVFVLRPEADPAAVIQTLASDGRVRTVQRMQTFETLAISYRDELVELQSGLKALEALPAHAVATGRGVRIGIVDSGLDTAHPDLADRIALARDFVQAPAESADPSSPTDPEEHGTAVAGVIGADGANASGMVGVAPGAEILGLRGCWQEGGRGDGYCSSFSLARALNFALLNDVDVLNLSLGGPPDPLIEALVEAAIEQGIVVVAAHGETADTQFPASVEGAIAVASQPLGAEGTTLARLRASLAIGAAGNAG